MLFIYNTGSKSTGSQLLQQNRVKECNSEFSALEPSSINENPDMRLIDDGPPMVTACETGKAKIHDARCSPEVSRDWFTQKGQSNYGQKFKNNSNQKLS